MSFRSVVRRRRRVQRAVEPPDRAAVQQWLVARVAQQLEVDADAIATSVPLAEFGLDSRATQQLAGDLETWLGRPLSPTLIWDYPTIAAVAEYVSAGEQQPELAAS